LNFYEIYTSYYLFVDNSGLNYEIYSINKFLNLNKFYIVIFRPIKKSPTNGRRNHYGKHKANMT